MVIRRVENCVLEGDTKSRVKSIAVLLALVLFSLIILNPFANPTLIAESDQSVESSGETGTEGPEGTEPEEKNPEEKDPESVVDESQMKIDVKATKTWVGGPEDRPIVWFKLQRAIGENTPQDVPGAPIVKLEGVLEAVWSDLDKMNESGDAYIYSVVEVDADGNRLVLEDYEKTENGLTVTNTYVASPETSPAPHPTPAPFPLYPTPAPTPTAAPMHPTPAPTPTPTAAPLHPTPAPTPTAAPLHPTPAPVRPTPAPRTASPTTDPSELPKTGEVHALPFVAIGLLAAAGILVVLKLRTKSDR